MVAEAVNVFKGGREGNAETLHHKRAKFEPKVANQDLATKLKTQARELRATEEEIQACEAKHDTTQALVELVQDLESIATYEEAYVWICKE